MPLATLVATLVIHVLGAAHGASAPGCLLRLSAHVQGGGTMTYCLKTFSGIPGPNAVVHDAGVMTFALPGGTIRARVRVVQRYGADGKHARQTLTGTVLGGTRRYRGRHGSISGGGVDVETAPGVIASSRLVYRLT